MVFEHTEEFEFEKKVGSFLINKKCPNRLGMFYLKSCITRVFANAILIGNLNGALYVEVAREFNTEVANVERCIRNICMLWWNDSKCAGLFPGNINRPSNKDLIVVVMDAVKKWKSGTENIRTLRNFEEDEHHISVYEQALG